MSIRALIIEGGDSQGNPEERPRGSSEVICALNTLWTPRANITYLANAQQEEHLSTTPKILGNPTKDSIARIIEEDARRISWRDAYLVVMLGHGNVRDVGPGHESYFGLGTDLLYEKELEQMLRPLGTHQQLLVVNACKDTTFGNLANRHRAVLTACSAPEATTHSLLGTSARRAFFDAVSTGKTYAQAYTELRSHILPDIENPYDFLREKMNWEGVGLDERMGSLPMLHGPKGVQSKRLASYAPLELQIRRWKRRTHDAYTLVKQTLRERTGIVQLT